MEKSLITSYNKILCSAVKADMQGRHKDADYLFGEAHGMLHTAYIMYAVLGTETVAKMSRASELAYDIVAGEVEEEESIYILENNMA